MIIIETSRPSLLERLRERNVIVALNTVLMKLDFNNNTLVKICYDKKFFLECVHAKTNTFLAKHCWVCYLTLQLG